MTQQKKIKVALMSYPMDHRAGKGSVLSTHRIVERLVRDSDLDVTLVHFEDSDDPLYREAREIIMPRLPGIFNRRFLRTLAFFWKFRKERFDIIHWFQPRVYPFFWWAPARHIVVTVHGGGDVTAPGPMPLSRRVFNFVLTHFSNRISAVIGVSEFGRREIIEAYGMSPERVVSMIHYNGGAEEFHTKAKSKARAELAKRFEAFSQPYILDVSRLNPHKNVDTLIRAYTLLRQRYPIRKERLVIVGGPSYRSDETYSLAKSSPFSADIKFVEYVPQESMNDIYAGAEAFVFPSLNEGFGMPLIESFASGTPVITSNVTALPEVAADAAILIDPMDAGAISEAIQRVLSDSALRENLIKKGIERAKPFTWDRSASDVKNLYIDVMRGHRLDH